MNIKRLQNREDIAQVFTKQIFPRMFFTQPQILHTFLNKEGFELHVVEHVNKQYFFVRKLHTGELRCLFEVFPDEVIARVKETFDPPYISYNLLAENPHQEHQHEERELVVDIEKYLSLDHKRLRKHYKQAITKNTNVAFRDFKSIPKKDLEQFWQAWTAERSTREKFVDRTLHDARFLDMYIDTEFFGTAAYDGEKLVAYSIGVHHSTGYCLSAFNKSLRIYTNLGLQISYEKAKKAKVLGYTHMNLAWIQNDFKKQFIPVGNLLPLYAFELWRKETFKTLTPHGYTSGLLR
jgi:hypothetical protein